MSRAVSNVYEAPAIQSLVLPADKQWAGARSIYPVSTEQQIGGVALREIRAKFGSPVFIVSEEALRQNYRTFTAAFRSRYPDTVIAYSYKTNYVSGILRVLHQEGAHAEVVSGFELALARSLGVRGRDIVYNGPHKSLDSLRDAIALGARINADSLEELSDLQELAGEANRRVKVGIRVNMALNDPPWDRFGFNLESGQALEACRQVHASRGLSLVGFHLHAGTFLTQVDLYARAVTGLLALAKTVEARGWGVVEYLDLGGGYASHNTLQGQLLPGELTMPGPDQYAEAICRPLKAGLRGLRRRPVLILEPGRALVDDPVSLLVSVVAVKTLAGGRRGIVVDGGVNLLPTAYYFRHAVHAGQHADGPPESADLLGPLCMQIDVLRRDIALPPLERGAILLIRQAGAYTISNSMQFIYPRPPVVMVSDGVVHLLRRGERTGDLVRLDVIPRHLQSAGLPRRGGAGNGRRR
jgi:diaminopimelate decarboxylase